MSNKKNYIIFLFCLLVFSCSEERKSVITTDSAIVIDSAQIKSQSVLHYTVADTNIQNKKLIIQVFSDSTRIFINGDQVNLATSLPKEKCNGFYIKQKSQPAFSDYYSPNDSTFFFCIWQSATETGHVELYGYQFKNNQLRRIIETNDGFYLYLYINGDKNNWIARNKMPETDEKGQVFYTIIPSSFQGGEFILQTEIKIKKSHPLFESMYSDNHLDYLSILHEKY
jgi:hypothetical protein